MEAIQMSITWWMNKGCVAYKYIWNIIQALKKSFATCNDMDGPRGYYYA